MFTKRLLFSPGPVITSERVKKAVLNPDICHRSKDFEELYSEIREKLVNIFKGNKNDYLSIVVSGSGTASNETVISSVLNEGEKILIITNGEFGNRLIEITDTYKINSEIIKYEWGEYPAPEDVEKKLISDKSIKLVSMVYHETSTGMINPVKKIGEIVKQHNKLFHVDAVSAIGGENVNIINDKVDFYTGVPNKSLAGLPGVSFVVINREGYDQIKNKQGKNVYLNLQKHVKMADEFNQTPNTPSVPIFISLNEALNEIFEEGLENRINRYKKDAEIIRGKMKELNLKLLVSEKDKMSNTVTSVFLPEKIDVKLFLNEMFNKGYVLYPGKGPLLEKNMFQIANMGQIYPEDCVKFTNIFSEVFSYMMQSSR